MRVQNVAGALVKPKGITKNSNAPYLVTQVVFASSPSAMRTCQYPDRRSSFEKYFALPNWSNKSAMSGMGYLFFTITLLRAR